ncbi:hypothetical protein [Streptomyces sp. NPDC001658]
MRSRRELFLCLPCARHRRQVPYGHGFLKKGEDGRAPGVERASPGAGRVGRKPAPWTGAHEVAPELSQRPPYARHRLQVPYGHGFLKGGEDGRAQGGQGLPRAHGLPRCPYRARSAGVGDAPQTQGEHGDRDGGAGTAPQQRDRARLQPDRRTAVHDTPGVRPAAPVPAGPT